MDEKNEVWTRIIEFCSLIDVEPKITFLTKYKHKFYIIKETSSTIRVYLLGTNNREWTITREQIMNDLDAGHPRENELVKDYPLTAQSYRYGLLHDERIYKRK